MKDGRCENVCNVCENKNQKSENIFVTCKVSDQY